MDRFKAKLNPKDPVCPSCSGKMQVCQLKSNIGNDIELDICFSCHGIWFDNNESIRLAPEGVLELFKLLNSHKDIPHTPIANTLRCARCPRPLEKRTDFVKSGRYLTYRCPNNHGRFSTFSSFFIEKSFVRQLNKAEIETLAAEVKHIECSACGASVDLRKHHSCNFCGAAFSLLDPAAVEKALEGLKLKIDKPKPSNNDVADAMLVVDRINNRRKEELNQKRILDKDEEEEPSLLMTLIGIVLYILYNIYDKK